MPRTNKRVAHHVGVDRDMRLIFGRPNEKKLSAPAPKGGVGPSNADSMIEELTARRKKFASK
jgi:hypothetical protein